MLQAAALRSAAAHSPSLQSPAGLTPPQDAGAVSRPEAAADCNVSPFDAVPCAEQRVRPQAPLPVATRTSGLRHRHQPASSVPLTSRPCVKTGTAL